MCPLPSPPKDIQHGGQCSCQNSLDGSSPLQQDSSCFNKLIGLTFQAQKTRSSGNSVATDGNAARGFHTLAVWTSQQVAAFRPDPKLLHKQKWGWQDPPLHQYPIFPKIPNQRLPFAHSNASSQKAFQKEASTILPKATNTVGLATT